MKSGVAALWLLFCFLPPKALFANAPAWQEKLETGRAALVRMLNCIQTCESSPAADAGRLP